MLYLCRYVMSRKRKIGYAVAGIVTSPVVLFVVLAALLYLPPVQKWAVDKACVYASKQTGMDIRLNRIRLKFLLDLDLQGLTATQRQKGDVLDVSHVVVDLYFGHILQGRLGVEALDIVDGTVDTQGMIATLRVKGHVGDFHLRADDINLKSHVAELSSAMLSGSDVDIAMRDTTVVDTTESEPLMWTLRLGDIGVENTRVTFRTAGDTLMVRGGVRSMHVKEGDLNLGKGIYRIGQADLQADSLSYDATYEPRLRGFDYNHLALRDVEACVQDFSYSDEGLGVYVTECQGTEKCGLQLCHTQSHVWLDNDGIRMPDLQLATASSTAAGSVSLDWRALTPHGGGLLATNLRMAVGKSDVEILVPQYAGYLPESSIELTAKADGNVDTLRIDSCRLLIEPMIDARTSGVVTNVLETDHLGADLNWDVKTYDMSTVSRLTGLDNRVRLPQMQVTGPTSLHGSKVTADLAMRQGSGRATLKGDYDWQTEAYHAKLNARNLQLHNFLPKDSLYALTARADVQGRGLDFLSRQTRLRGSVDVDHLRYGHYNIDNTQARLKLSQGQGLVDLYIDNGLLSAQACIEAEMDRTISLANFSMDLNRIDLYALGLVDKPFVASMLMHVDGNSNLKDVHQVKGSMQAIEFVLRDTVVHPLDLDFEAHLTSDSLYAAIDAGDLEVQLHSREGLDTLLAKCTRFADEAQRQYTAHQLDQPLLKSMLPTATIRLRSGSSNPICNMLSSAIGYSYHTIDFNLDSNPRDGLNGNGRLHGLNTGAVQLDTISWHLYQDCTGVVNMGAHVENGSKNKQVVFSADVLANLTPTGAGASIAFYDAKKVKGVDLGAILDIEDEGMRLRLHPLNPVIAYRGFTLNHDNFIYLRNDRHLEADVDLLADDGTGFKLYSTPNAEALQDITLSIHDFNLGELSSVVPYMPDVRGLLAGDFHLVQDESQMSVSVDAAVSDLVYEGIDMGKVGLNAMYLPNSDGTHYVDGIVLQNDNEVMLLSGTYNPEGGGSIDAEASLQRLPLALVNGFLPEHLMELRGYVVGGLSVKGSVSSPILNGSLQTDSMYLTSEPYSVNLRFPDDTLTIRDSQIDLNRIEAYSTGRNPVILDGTIDCRNLNNIGMNLRLDAKRFELVNAPKTRKALAYGKVYVNLGATLTGTLNNLKLRGGLTVLGDTEVTYVLADSPLTVEDELADLVTFVDFTDTVHVEPVEPPSPQNIDMQMNISIEQAAQVHCLLSEDGTNYVDIEGGGDLLMTYTTRDDLKLYGRYTVVSGKMNYSLMVMSLKDCAIENGSYVEFTGDISNPRLNLRASERVKTTVYDNSVPRSVAFDVGMSVTQTLDNMGLEFTLEAPEDLTISNQLATMSTEERGKVAVTMLATGMYLTDEGSMNGFSGANALNSFLQTQISAINSKALSTIDLNFGVDNTSTASGASQTDYSFSFAKRFWGNRISIVIGGKVSSGSEAQNTGQSIIDNVSVEYRLDKSATRYVRLYYDRNTESLMEGEIMEMGAGIVFRKKSTRLGELFLFRRK